jgi:enamine deaminase RidA (YjgF/YER057c/UK114 family)
MTIERINPAGLHTPRGYSHVAIVSAGMQIHLSGQVALDPDGAIVGVGDIAAQAEQVYANVKAALHGAGAPMSKIAKLVTYIVDLTPEKAAVVRAVRLKYLGEGPYPASTMIGVASLVHPDFLIEIEAIAVQS